MTNGGSIDSTEGVDNNGGEMSGNVKGSKGSTIITAPEETADENTPVSDKEPVAFGETKEVFYGEGTIVVEVECITEDGSESAQTGYLSGESREIMQSLLTPEELKAVEAGESAVIKPVVGSISNGIPPEDREQITNALGEIADEPLTLGRYIDFSVLKKVGDGDWQKITRCA